MGLINTIKKTFTKTNNGLPNSGGTSFTTNERIKAVENFTKARAELINGDFSNAIYGDKIHSYYEWIQLEGDYWTSRQVYASPSSYLNMMIKLTQRASFFDGISALYLNSDNVWEVIRILKMKQVADTPSYIEYMPISVDSFTTNFTREESTDFKIIKDEKDLKRVAILRFGDGIKAWGAWVWLKPFTNMISMFNKLIITGSLIYTKKFALNVKNSESITDELKAFFDLDNPFIMNLESYGKLEQNKISVIEAVQKGDNKVIFDFIDQAQNFFYAKYGRRHNIDTKQSGERNLTAEVATSQDAFDQMEKVQRSYSEDFIKKVSEIAQMEIVEV